MKKTRLDKVVEIIQNYDVETQEELAARLRDAGFAVTQATVSRDIMAADESVPVRRVKKFLEEPT